MIFYELNVLFCSLKLKMSWFLGMVIKATKDQVRIKLFLKDKTKHSIFHMLKVGSCKSRQGTSTVQGLCRNTKVSLQVQQTAPLYCKSAELCGNAAILLQLKQPFYRNYAVKDWVTACFLMKTQAFHSQNLHYQRGTFIILLSWFWKT